MGTYKNSTTELECPGDCNICSLTTCVISDELTYLDMVESRQLDQDILKDREYGFVDMTRYIHGRDVGEKEAYIKARNKQYDHKRYIKHRDSILNKKKTYYNNNKEDINRKSTEYYYKHKQERLLYQAYRYEQHKEEINRKRREKYKARKEKANEHNNEDNNKTINTYDYNNTLY